LASIWNQNGKFVVILQEVIINLPFSKVWINFFLCFEVTVKKCERWCSLRRQNVGR
jgi:hypothetical protein